MLTVSVFPAVPTSGAFDTDKLPAVPHDPADLSWQQHELQSQHSTPQHSTGPNISPWHKIPCVAACIKALLDD